MAYVVVHVAVSLDGATTGFQADLGRFYTLAAGFGEDVTLAGPTRFSRRPRRSHRGRARGGRSAAGGHRPPRAGPGLDVGRAALRRALARRAARRRAGRGAGRLRGRDAGRQRRGTERGAAGAGLVDEVTLLVHPVWSATRPALVRLAAGAAGAFRSFAAGKAARAGHGSGFRCAERRVPLSVLWPLLLCLAGSLALLAAGCGGEEEPRAETARPTASPVSTPTPIPEPRRPRRRAGRGLHRRLRARKFPGICQRFDPSDRPACYGGFKQNSRSRAAKQQREIAEMKPGRVRVVQGGERAVVELDVGSQEGLREDLRRALQRRVGRDHGGVLRARHGAESLSVSTRGGWGA